MIDNDIENKITNDLNTIWEHFSKKKIKPTAKYFSFFKSQYAIYNKDTVDAKNIQKRYLIETVLLNYFHCILKNINPGITTENLIHDFYVIEKFDVSTQYINTKNITATYLTATKILLHKNNKYFCEFYTPSFISRMIVEYIPNSAFSQTDNTFLDPSCGVGSILSDLLLRYINAQHNNKEVNSFIENQLYGYDILPFSVTATKLQIATIHQYCCSNTKLPSLKNIQLQDTLHSHPTRKFTYILANPPYMKTLNNKEIIGKHHDIIRGHPNLYLLFLLWSLDNIESEGQVIFLLPQTLRVGSYNHNFRKLINTKYFLNRISIFFDRTNIFADVEQRIMIISFSLNKTSDDVKISICTTKNNSVSKKYTYSKPYEELTRTDENTTLWQLPISINASKIIEKINSNTIKLYECGFTHIGTGSYVWNQHKDDLTNESNAAVLLYSNNIQDYEVIVPHTFNYKGKKQFSKSLIPNSKFLDNDIILIKRTTGQESKYKIVAGLLGQKIIKMYPSYYLENHVHYIYTNNDILKKRYKAIICWLNSPLLNYYFSSICSTSHISLYEIKTLPINMNLMDKLVPLSDRYFKTKNITDLEKINKAIYSFFNLTRKEITEIKQYFGG